MDDWSPEPQEYGWREPPRRRPPTAVGIATPPPPPRPPRLSRRAMRLERIGSVFAQLAFATACGLAAGEFLPVAVLGTSLAGLIGARFVLQRQHSSKARRLLYLGSSPRRRAA